MEPDSDQAAPGSQGAEVDTRVGNGPGLHWTIPVRPARRRNMKSTLMKVAFVVAALALLAGCGSKVRYPNYYTINLPAPQGPPAVENAHASLAIREFRAPAYLRQGAI